MLKMTDCIIPDFCLYIRAERNQENIIKQLHYKLKVTSVLNGFLIYIYQTVHSHSQGHFNHCFSSFV